MTHARPTLILVYNADGGVVSAVRDWAHKLVSPATYPCSLCGLTYGTFAMRREWRRFLDRIGMPVLFLYRDEFRAYLGIRDMPLPAILIGGRAGRPEVLISAAELAVLGELGDLIALVERRLAGVSG